MITLIYVSAAVKQFDDRELSDLLAVSRRNNAARNLTGMLCHADGNFMQALEGEADAVDALERTLEADPRHTGMIRILRYPIAERLFGNWSMALSRLDCLSAADQADCALLMTLRFPAAGPQQSDIAIRLLESFRETMA